MWLKHDQALPGSVKFQFIYRDSPPGGELDVVVEMVARPVTPKYIMRVNWEYLLNSYVHAKFNSPSGDFFMCPWDFRNMTSTQDL